MTKPSNQHGEQYRHAALAKVESTLQGHCKREINVREGKGRFKIFRWNFWIRTCRFSLSKLKECLKLGVGHRSRLAAQLSYWGKSDGRATGWFGHGAGHPMQAVEAPPCGKKNKKTLNPKSMCFDTTESEEDTLKTPTD
jgi:hypothetical protein